MGSITLLFKPNLAFSILFFIFRYLNLWFKPDRMLYELFHSKPHILDFKTIRYFPYFSCIPASFFVHISLLWYFPTQNFCFSPSFFVIFIPLSTNFPQKVPSLFTCILFKLLVHMNFWFIDKQIRSLLIKICFIQKPPIS